MDYHTALIVGTGSGLSASLARLFAKSGMKVAVAARRLENLATLAQEIGGKAFTCDATDLTIQPTVNLFGSGGTLQTVGGGTLTLLKEPKAQKRAKKRPGPAKAETDTDELEATERTAEAAEPAPAEPEGEE